jgi:hypothetical protein
MFWFSYRRLKAASEGENPTSLAGYGGTSLQSGVACAGNPSSVPWFIVPVSSEREPCFVDGIVDPGFSNSTADDGGGSGSNGDDDGFWQRMDQRSKHVGSRDWCVFEIIGTPPTNNATRKGLQTSAAPSPARARAAAARFASVRPVDASQSPSPSPPDDDESPPAPHTYDTHTVDAIMEAARADLIAAERSGNLIELAQAKQKIRVAHALLVASIK